MIATLKLTREDLRPRQPSLILRRAVAAAAWVYAAMVVCVCGLLWLFSDRWAVATAIAFGPRWIFGLPLLVLVPAVGLLRRRLLLLMAGVVLLVAGPLMGWSLPWGRLSGTTGPSLRVMTCNLNGQKSDLNALLLLVADVQPDVVALQECHNQPIDALWPSDWHVRQVGSLTVASCFPVRVVRVIRDRSNWTTAVQCRVNTPWSEISIVNLHLPSPRTGLDMPIDSEGGRNVLAGLERNIAIREAASDQAERMVSQIGGPLVIAGDFNLPTASRIYQTHWSTLGNAFSASGFGLGHSKMTDLNGWQYGTRIDHILTGTGWKARRCWVSRNIGSDHLPVVADLVWTGETADNEASGAEDGRPCAPSMIAIDPGEFDALCSLLCKAPQTGKSGLSRETAHRGLDDFADRPDAPIAGFSKVEIGPNLNVHCRYITLDTDGWFKLPTGKANASLRSKVGSSRLRLSADDCEALVPDDTSRGATSPVAPRLAKRILRYGLVDRSRSDAAPWAAEHIRCYRMSLTVRRRDEHEVQLRLDGQALLATAANPALAERGYAARLLGYVTCSLVDKTLTRFDVVAVGDLWNDGDRHRGVAPGRPLLGVAIQLADESQVAGAAQRQPSGRLPTMGSTMVPELPGSPAVATGRGRVLGLCQKDLSSALFD